MKKSSSGVHAREDPLEYALEQPMSRCSPPIFLALSVGALGGVSLPAPAVAAEAAPTPPSLSPTPALNLERLEAIVRERSPALRGLALEAGVAAAEVEQSLLLDNPVLDAAWGTIPLGESNPPNLPRPFANVPSYTVGLSYTVPLGKRGPRQEQARALERGTRAVLRAGVRQEALNLARALGGAAALALRLTHLGDLEREDERALSLAEARFAAGAANELDVDRLKIELSRTRQQRLATGAALEEALAACAAGAGMRCERFASEAEARAFLAAWTLAAAPAADLGQRPDLVALDAYREAAEAEGRLAERQKIPDPTVRLAYTHDRFLESGNHMNSLDLSVSLPLPVFDRGQAQAQAASARRTNYAMERALRLTAAEARLPLLVERLSAQRQRQAMLAEDVIPRARKVLEDVARATEARLLGLADLIQARRALGDLLLEEVDSHQDAFASSLELLAELPGADAASRTTP